MISPRFISQMKKNSEARNVRLELGVAEPVPEERHHHGGGQQREQLRLGEVEGADGEDRCEVEIADPRRGVAASEVVSEMGIGLGAYMGGLDRVDGVEVTHRVLLLLGGCGGAVSAFRTAG
jgi:hypothetical protein